MKPTERRYFTEEEFVSEILIASFLGVFKFWTQIENSRDMRHTGEELLRIMGMMALRKREASRRRASPEELEAYRHCGLPVDDVSS